MTTRVGRRLAIMGAMLLAGCKAQPPSPPAGEFLLAAGDSTFWVTTGPNGVQVRSAPLMLGHFSGRFYELYVTDDDLSYPEAELIGQRLYRRDLVSGDSMLVYADTVVQEIAAQYAASHPDVEPLAPDEEMADEPSLHANAELEILDTHGPYLSFEYHLDVAAEGDDRHLTSRGVVDMRNARRVRIEDLFDDTTAARIHADADTAFAEALDSVLASKSPSARRAARTLSDFELNRLSFALAELDRAAGVLFLAPGVGERVGGFALPLRPIVGGHPAWWRAILRELPRTSTDSSTDRWDRPAMQVVAYYDGTAESLTLAIRDTQQREWRSRRLMGPAHRIYWLDSLGADRKMRSGLQRAFDESVLYSEDARRAMRTPRRAGTARFARFAHRGRVTPVTHVKHERHDR